MPDKKLLSGLEAVSILPSFLIVLVLIPVSALLSNPISLEQFSLILVVPIALGLIRAFLNIDKGNKILSSASAVIGGVLIGISAGYGLLSLIVLFNWQSSPEIGHLEPLFVVFGVAAAAVETGRRLTVSDVTS